MRNERIDIGRSRWLRVTDPIIKVAVKHPGFVSRVARELDKVGQGKRFSRQQIWPLLNPDPQKRRQPLLGLGLVLIDACNRVALAYALEAAAAKGTPAGKSEGKATPPRRGAKAPKKGGRLPKLITHSETGA